MGEPSSNDPEKPQQQPDASSLRCKVTGINCDVRPVILTHKTMATREVALSIAWMCVRCKQQYIPRATITEAPGGGDAYCILLFKPSPIVTPTGGQQEAKA